MDAMQHKTGRMIWFFIIVLWASACFSDDGHAYRSQEQGSRFTLLLTPGEYHTGKGGWFVFSYSVYPQVAVWLETTDGKYLETLYVTRKADEGTWRAAPDTGRPEALPVWSHLRRALPNGVSSATATQETYAVRKTSGSLPAGRYVVMLEANRSYLYNDAYPKSVSGVNGQPSVVYRAEITIGQGSTEAGFAPVGTGSPDGSNGEIRYSLEGIDTALQLFSDMKIVYAEE